jgi:hypothetical protein
MVSNRLHDYSIINSLSTALRLQWCRARARASRWSEEILLLQEEMRRVLAYLSWYADWWSSQAQVAFQHQDHIVSEGFMAYAEKQAQLRQDLKLRFQHLWKDVPLWIKGGSIPDKIGLLDDLEMELQE